MSLYHEAADILSTSCQEGGSLKSRVFGRKTVKSPPNQLYALVCETCKWSAILKEVVEGADLLRHERKLTPALALLLVHDLLLAKGGIALPQSHGLRTSIDRHKGRLSSEFTRARVRRKAPSVEALRAKVELDAAGEEAKHPRWVRVNALKGTLEEQLGTTFRSHTTVGTIQEVVSKQGGNMLFLDAHVPNLLAVSPGCDLSKTEAYKSGKIILQDKASCFPAYLLDPRPEDGDVVDACAAPGNKTTHLAGIIHGHTREFAPARQTIFAFEKDSRRAQTLEKMVKTAGSEHMTRIGRGQDFLQVDPTSERYRNVGALLLDPSCSGSGIIGRDSMPALHLPSQPVSQSHGGVAAAPSRRKRKLAQVAGEPEERVIRDDDGNETVVGSERDLAERLEALSSFQLTLLLHAFRFPRARKVTYSTCSVHSQENEHVVVAALRSDVARERGWRIMRRDEQVGGMRSWPVRGLAEACGGDEVAAEGCIRCNKDDGHGVMGFFVAGFVREAAEGGGADGPSVRDESGAIARDVLEKPASTTTGAAVRLAGGGDEDATGGNRGGGEEGLQDGEQDGEQDGDEQSEWGGLDD
ncbi:uncharacterized protein UV8b_03689 [Ustilaginoidea virens]|uniref:SAM-dependent MTase RsmB/NOP-type domain-containing protein n=1 Tax=Ustilaginoidea virens TaxID=1159556 RepID=A0A063BZT1_USTVR|nr:uncharacterized protein UV8b_03689 [Ustilaginoidea virens]QUC19448.1 hypothetical protein UV8b_03689 [Ustilaginoidea virens]GAO13275.1 hypothetical protein UVI_02026200 [Ustilaginoidea virens]